MSDCSGPHGLQYPCHCFSNTGSQRALWELLGLPDSSAGKEPACNAGDPSLIPGSGRSSGEGIGYPLQYSGLENSMDSIVHGVAKSWTWTSDFHFTVGALAEAPWPLPSTFSNSGDLTLVLPPSLSQLPLPEEWAIAPWQPITQAPLSGKLL